MDTKDRKNLNSREHIRRRKLWVILVIVAVFFGMYGSYKLMQTGKLQEWAIANTQKMILLEEKSLSRIENNIKKAQSEGAKTDDLERERKESLKNIERLKKELELLILERDEFRIQSLHPKMLLDSPSLSVNNAYAAEQEINNIAKKNDSMSLNEKDSLRRYVLFAVLLVLAIVYIIVNYKVWFSTNPKNMDLASDLMKTITGFWIGLGTAVF